jgi:plastocyanin
VARPRFGLAAAAAGVALVAGSGCAAIPWWRPGELVLRRAGDAPREAVVYLEAASGSSGPVGGAVVEVRSRGESFSPPLTAVQAGDRIRFVNEGAVAHRLFTAESSGRRERLVAAGGRAEPLLISRAGESRFYCSLHPDESFLVFASPSPWFAVLGPAGEHHIGGIPRGSYRLTLWSETGLRPLGSVEVRSGEPTTFTIPGRLRSGG